MSIKNLLMAWNWGVTTPVLFAKNLRGAMFRRPAPPPCLPDIDDCPENGLRFTWLGHATVLIDIAGRRVLTDPHLGNWVLFSRRLIAPPIRPDAIPDLDLVLISHSHFDHLDRGTLKQINPGADIVVPPACTDLVSDLGFSRVHEMQPGDRVKKDGLEIMALKVPHTPHRHPLSKPRGHCGYVITRNGVSVLFIGDARTMDGSFIAGLGLNIEVAVLPISSYEPKWYRVAHMEPEDTVKLFIASGAKRLLPIHRETFILSYEPVAEPLERLLKAADKAGISAQLLLPRMGETIKTQK
ncbi:MBL fold metallo-hydrolase [Acidobacteriota bacterium]